MSEISIFMESIFSNNGNFDLPIYRELFAKNTKYVKRGENNRAICQDFLSLKR